MSNKYQVSQIVDGKKKVYGNYYARSAEDAVDKASVHHKNFDGVQNDQVFFVKHGGKIVEVEGC